MIGVQGIPMALAMNAGGFPEVTMVAGQSGGGSPSIGFQADDFGSMSGNLLPDFPTLRLWSRSGLTSLELTGDCSAIVTGLSLLVDGVAYALPTPFLSSGDTFINWSSGGPVFVSGHTYTLQLAEA